MAGELPMHDVVKLVLEAEAQSKRVLGESEAEAQRLIAEARREAQEIVQAMRRETAEQADSLLRAAADDALRERSARLTRATAEMEAAVVFDEPLMREVVAAVVRRVSAT